MIAEIVAIGTELVSGQSLDTNSQWLSRALGSLGIAVHFHTALGDDLPENIAALKIAIGRADLVITSGGLGPTQDDLTREALAAVAGVSLVEDPGSLAAIAAMFARRNRPMAERNRVQAMRPEGSEVLPNSCGTAPGLWMKVGKSIVACLPGVPNELKRMFEEQVAPRLRGLGATDRVIVHRKINLFGRGESDVEANALDLTARGRVPEVGITVSEATISFRITASGGTEAEALALMAPTAAAIYERFGPLIVGEGDEDVVDALVRELTRTGTSLAVAESCTGGMIASALTEIPGVSEVFLGGVVSYANAAKVDLLGVPARLIEEHGAVSAEVAEAMARGARERFHADLGLSVTGIAGPSGGTPEKPVGLVYLGLATAEAVESRRLEIGPEQPRQVIRGRSAKNAMNWARMRAAGIG
jgi:nicotinamide-nucleotide amidase